MTYNISTHKKNFANSYIPKLHSLYKPLENLFLKDRSLIFLEQILHFDVCLHSIQKFLVSVKKKEYRHLKHPVLFTFVATVLVLPCRNVVNTPMTEDYRVASLAVSFLICFRSSKMVRLVIDTTEWRKVSFKKSVIRYKSLGMGLTCCVLVAFLI